MAKTMKKYVSLMVALVAISALSGCVSVKVVGEYDERTDVAVTQIQRKMELFLIGLERNMGKDAASYANNTKFYDEIKADVSSARVRVAAIPGNEYVNQELGFIGLYILNLEKTHEYGIRADDIPLIRTSFNNSCTTILRRELAKKF